MFTRKNTKYHVLFHKDTNLTTGSTLPEKSRHKSAAFVGMLN